MGPVLPIAPLWHPSTPNIATTTPLTGSCGPTLPRPRSGGCHGSHPRPPCRGTGATRSTSSATPPPPCWSRASSGAEEHLIARGGGKGAPSSQQRERVRGTLRSACPASGCAGANARAESVLLLRARSGVVQARRMHSAPVVGRRVGGGLLAQWTWSGWVRGARETGATGPLVACSASAARRTEKGHFWLGTAGPPPQRGARTAPKGQPPTVGTVRPMLVGLSRRRR